MLRLKKLHEDTWYITGTVRVGRSSRRIRLSTGTSTREVAEQLLREKRVQMEQELAGIATRARDVPLARAISSYLDEHPDLHRNDRAKLQAINDHLGTTPISQIDRAVWRDFIATRLEGRGSDTINRWRATFMAVLNLAAETLDVKIPKIPKLAVRVPPPRFLTMKEQEALLAAYAAHVRPIATMLCFQGCRVGEALRLQASDVLLEQSKVVYRDTKNGTFRVVPLHPRVRKALEPLLWGKEGHVFLNRHGEPYRDYRAEGGAGIPIAKAHATALKNAGIKGFRIHDWRHHFASWLIMNGGSSLSLMELAGWRDERMVRRYVGLAPGHLQKEIRRLK